MCTAPAHRTTFLRKLSLVRCARPPRIARSSSGRPPLLRIACNSSGRPPSLRIACSSSGPLPSLRIARSFSGRPARQPVLAHRTQFLGAVREPVRPCASQAVSRLQLRGGKQNRTVVGNQKRASGNQQRPSGYHKRGLVYQKHNLGYQYYGFLSLIHH